MNTFIVILGFPIILLGLVWELSKFAWRQLAGQRIKLGLLALAGVTFWLEVLGSLGGNTPEPTVTIPTPPSWQMTYNPSTGDATTILDCARGDCVTGSAEARIVTTTANNDPNYVPLRIQDDSGGSPDTLLELNYQGNLTIEFPKTPALDTSAVIDNGSDGDLHVSGVGISGVTIDLGPEDTASSNEVALSSR